MNLKTNKPRESWNKLAEGISKKPKVNVVKREKKEAEGDAANKDDSEKEKVVKSDGGM